VPAWSLDARQWRGLDTVAAQAELELSANDQLGRLVALKIMAPSVASDAEFRQRFVRESKAAPGH
jgi:hypothetical protein